MLSFRFWLAALPQTQHWISLGNRFIIIVIDTTTIAIITISTIITITTTVTIIIVIIAGGEKMRDPGWDPQLLWSRSRRVGQVLGEDSVQGTA